MMQLRFIDTKEPWNGGLVGDVRYPRSIATNWTVPQLKKIGLEPVPVPEPVDVPPSTNPDDYPLQPFQFEAMLEILGKVKAVDDAIDAITDLKERAIARGKRRSPPDGVFHRNDPLFAKLAPVVGLTKAQIDTAWMQAKDLA